jgi:hypothetical protein
MRARRMRYSTLLWPQLYSRLQILLLCLLACAVVTAATITVYLLTQPDTATYTRAAERARSGLQMKLAGIDAWRWRQNFACQNMPDDCLKLKLQFGAAAADSGQHTIRLTSPEACAICHAGETAQFAQLHAVFPVATGQKRPAVARAGHGRDAERFVHRPRLCIFSRCAAESK